MSTISSLTVENEDCLQQGFRERYYGLSFRHSHSFIINCANYFKSALKFSFCVVSFLCLLEKLIRAVSWGPFLESPENFSGPKSHS